MVGEEAFVGFPFPLEEIPTIPSLGLAFWLDAARGVTTDGATTRVANWTGRVVANGASQATASQMPLLVANGRHGLPTVRFDGADDSLGLAAPVPPGPISIFVAAAVSDTSNVRGFLGAGAGVGWGYRHDPSGILNLTRQTQADYNSASGLIAGTWSVFGATWDGATVRHYKDGATNGTNEGVTVIPSAVSYQIGCLADRPLLGDIGEMIAYTRGVSPYEAARIQAYLRGRWG